MLSFNSKKDILKEDVKSECLFAVGTEFQRTNSVVDLRKLKELDMFLSRAGQLEWKKLGWALKPSMIGLLQTKLLEHPVNDLGSWLPLISA